MKVENRKWYPLKVGIYYNIGWKINNNEDTEFTIGFPIEYNSNSIPNIKKISEMQPIRILRDGGWFIYEYSNLKN